jgi:hypothetical protein
MSIQFTPEPAFLKRVNPSPKVSHETAILRYLAKFPNTWVPLPIISLYTAEHCRTQCYVVHSRIASLRKRGHVIDNDVRHDNGMVCSFYRLEVKP